MLHITNTIFTQCKKSGSIAPMKCYHSFSDCSLKECSSILGITQKQLFNYLNRYRLPPENIEQAIYNLAKQLDFGRELFIQELKNNDLKLNNRGSHR